MATGWKIWKRVLAGVFVLGLALTAKRSQAAGLAPNGPAEEEAFRRQTEEMVKERERYVNAQSSSFAGGAKGYRDAVAKQVIQLRGHPPNSPDGQVPPTLIPAVQEEEDGFPWRWWLPFLCAALLTGLALFRKLGPVLKGRGSQGA